MNRRAIILSVNLSIDAIISRNDDMPMTDDDADRVLDGFVDWCEANGYAMFSVSKPIDDDGNAVSWEVAA